MVTRTKKIFVGGLSAPTTLEDVKNYFEQFGPVSPFMICCIFLALQIYNFIFMINYTWRELLQKKSISYKVSDKYKVIEKYYCR